MNDNTMTPEEKKTAEDLYKLIQAAKATANSKELHDAMNTVVKILESLYEQIHEINAYRIDYDYHTLNGKILHRLASTGFHLRQHIHSITTRLKKFDKQSSRLSHGAFSPESGDSFDELIAFVKDGIEQEYGESEHN